MKTLFTSLMIIAFPFLLNAQETLKKADALVCPKVAEQAITVGGPNAQVQGFNNQSIQFAIDAVAKTGGTVQLNQGVYEIKAN